MKNILHSQYKELYKRFGQRMEFSKYLLKIRYFSIADKKIYVLSYIKDAGKGEFHIYDFTEKLLKRIVMPFKEIDIIDFYPYTISDKNYIN